MRRWVVAVGVVTLVCLLSGLPVADATQDVGGADEDTVVVTVNPEGPDAVTVFFRVAETDNPYPRMAALAAEADVPVYNMTVRSVDAQVTTYVNGQTVSGGELYRTTLTTDLDRRTGPLGGAIPGETLAAFATAEEQTFVLFVPPGVSVVGGESWSHSLRAEGYVLTADDLTDEPVTYWYGLGSLLVLAAVLVGGSLGTYWLVRRTIRAIAARDDPLSDRVHAIRGTAANATLIGPVLPFAAGVWFGAVSLLSLLLDWALGTTPSGVVPTVTLWFIALGPFVCGPWVAATLATKPTYRDLIDVPYSLGNVLAEWAEGAAIRVAWYWVGVVAFVAFDQRISDQPIVGAALVTLLLVARAAVMPAVLRLLGRARPLSDDLQTELTDFCSRHGVTPRRIYRLDVGTETMVNGLLLGVPGLHTVFLTDDLVEACDRETIRAVLAHELGHLSHRHFLQRMALTLVFWYLAFFVYANVFTNLVTLAVAAWLYLQFGLGWLSQRHEYQADDYAAEATSPASMARALDQLASLNYIRRDTGTLYNLSAKHPSFEDRIDRLRDEKPPDEREDSESAADT